MQVLVVTCLEISRVRNRPSGTGGRTQCATSPFSTPRISRSTSTRRSLHLLERLAEVNLPNPYARCPPWMAGVLLF